MALRLCFFEIEFLVLFGHQSLLYWNQITRAVLWLMKNFMDIILGNGLLSLKDFWQLKIAELMKSLIDILSKAFLCDVRQQLLVKRILPNGAIIV